MDGRYPAALPRGKRAQATPSARGTQRRALAGVSSGMDFGIDRRALRRALPLLVVTVAAALGACSHRVIDWHPDPSLARRDGWFVSEGERIEIERVAPRGRGRGHPAVLVLHPSGGLRGFGGAYVRRYADELALNGYVAYIVHYFDRTGVEYSDDDMEEQDFLVWTDALRDAVTYAQRDSQVDPRKIGVFGFSLGGWMALALGATDTRVGAIVAIGAGFFDPVARQVVREPPTLLLHGADDGTVKLSEARRVDSTLARLRVPHDLVVYPGQGHGFADSADVDARRRTVRFFDRWLHVRHLRVALPGGHLADADNF